VCNVKAAEVVSVFAMIELKLGAAIVVNTAITAMLISNSRMVNAFNLEYVDDKQAPLLLLFMMAVVVFSIVYSLMAPI